ncbi:tetratricopeptide repeat protein [Thalassomonas viridans]|uniref:Tetratricopeptide repeat protein n=1 Tax=Thalassomonas viridans TaxID=137584 RepID=A0AAE9Z0E4_9GAMM|nr:tetratricopeptide repeat protein [Thalassomonas viridans]WDE02873.1 tetratricopeptide repeat protein [Thalassomonas viridans]
MRKTALCCLLSCSLFLVACQSTKVAHSPAIQAEANLYLDTHFPGYEQRAVETAEEIFAIDDEMRQMIAEQVAPEKSFKKRAVKLLQQIFKKDNLGLAYRSSANVVATDAYHTNTANCLSLTIMAYALAREAKLNVNFQEVLIPEYWVRHGEHNMLTGHVNLRLSAGKRPQQTIIFGSNDIEVDFDPFVIKKSFPKRSIKKSTVLAMFYNNKGAQALIDADYTGAYAYLKAATLADPGFSTGWGNLGLLYRFNGQIDLAKQTYRHAIGLSKRNFTAMSNLSLLLKKEGKVEEAAGIQREIVRKREKNPYYHALLADEAFHEGDVGLAVRLYKKAIKLDNKAHEFYFGLAKAYYRQGKLDSAKRAMKKAIALNRIPQTEYEYLAKLDFLKTAGKAN